MPGRQSTGPKPLLKARPQRQKRKRGLEAFAIADEEAQRSAKVRQSRLGLLEGGNSPRTGDFSEEDNDDDDDDDDKEKATRQSKRSRQGFDGGSDSEGNEWFTGHVPSDDDSSLDSDEAMGSSDEERFEGFTFRGSSSKKSARKDIRASHTAEGDVDLNEEESEKISDAESGEFTAAALDPAAILDQRDSESDYEDSEGNEAPTHNPPISLAIQDYSPDKDDLSQFSFSEEEGEDAETATKRLEGLQAFVTSLDNGKKGSALESHEGLVPTDFGITSKKKLSINDMLATITDPKARKSLRSLQTESKPSSGRRGVPQKLSVPLPKRQQDRIDRAAAYDKSKDILERWVETVKHNRRADHLEFPLPDPAAAAAKSNAHLSSEPSAKPITALESAIQRIMEESGIDATNGRSQDDQIQEFEELAANKMPIEEVRARRAQLRKTRELLFREEMKAKRIKKIKSKSWRKVHRKERERGALREKEMLAEAGIEPDEDELERSHRQRAEERMGGRHRASRWAKGVKQTGRAAWDEEARAGIHQMARREEELKKRMQGHDVDASSGSDSDSESDGESTSDEENGDGSRRLLNKLDKLQRQSEATSRLHSLPFMKKAEAARKSQNDEDIERLRRELAGEESPAEGDEEDEPLGRRKFGPEAIVRPKSESRPATRSEFEELEEANGLDVEFTGRNDVSSTNHSIRNGSKRFDQRPPKQTSSNSARSRQDEDAREQVHENPWMTVSKKNRSKNPTPASADIQISTTAELPAAHQAGHSSTSSSLHPQPQKHPAATLDISQTHDHPDSGSESDSSSEPNTPKLSNQALIRQAFAADDVLAAEFAAEKAALAAEEAADSADEVEEKLPGWGSWVGEGVPNNKRKKKNNNNQQNAAAKQAAASTAPAKLGKGKPNSDQRVIVSGKTQKPNGTYLATQLPHPFETKMQYERSLRLPVGPEWQTHAAFRAGTKPRVKVRAGEVIRPMRKPLM